MHIEEVRLDGFKSYSTETRVERFDTQFNAVTGQNGSGKSNIMDAICFVLGISNLSKVRVSNLSELVYKSGQAGITKASVTIVLNNEDKAPGRSPVGFETCSRIEVCRQIVIGGRNRYLINNVTAQQSQVHNLFHSVQLNVNNPHFLIMQGSISRVINMKAPEILGLIEEAAGTKMYETKKILARKTVEKRQSSFNDIDRIINLEITPTIAKLQEELIRFRQWHALSHEVVKLDRYLIGYDCCHLFDILDPGKIATLQDRLTKLSTQSEQIKREQAEAAKKLEAMATTNNAESLGPFQEDEKARKADVHQSENQLKNKQKLAENLTSKLAKYNKELEKARAQIIKKRPEAEEAAAKAIDAKEEVERLEESMEAIASGHSRGAEARVGSEIKMLQEQINGVKASEKSEVLHLKGLEDRLANSAAAGKSAEREWKKLEAEKRAVLAKIAEAKARLESLNFSESKYAELQGRTRSLENAEREQSSRLQELQGQIRGRYPIQPDHQIKGAVATLLTVKPEYEQYSLALEVIGGSRLGQYVIDTNDNAVRWLKSSSRKVTFLPLNKVDRTVLKVSKIQLAAELARSLGGEAIPALDAISFDESVRPVMELVFGTFLLCSSREISEKVCYHPGIRVKTMTINGDSSDPQGNMSGGSPPDNRSFKPLRASKELADLKAALKLSHESLAKASGDFARMRDLRMTFDEKSSELNRLNKELAIIDRSLASNDYQKETGSAADCEAQVADARAKLTSYREQLKLFEGRMADFQKQLQSLGGIAGESEEEKKKRDIANLKRQIKEQAEEAKNQKANAEAAANDISALQDEVKSIQETISATATEHATTADEVADLKLALEARRVKAEKANEALEKAKAVIEAANLEIAATSKLINTLKTRKEELDADTTKTKAKITHMQAEAKDAKAKLEKLEKDNPWIEAEKGSFYYADATPEAIAAKRSDLADMRQEAERQGRNVNKKAEAMCGKANKDFKDLQEKRNNLEKEKEDIENFIEDLDDKKGKALARTCQVVNQSFSSIFRSLLPNVNAKLEPPEGMSAIEGLELRVAFGDVWKESLTELSGGQKSLLALSLILALLRYKPAPFYILDEVDAALDVSHTTNIGHMIKTHFPDSQFIIVSLKDGMFNNANVLFRTRFEDGTSKVTRIQQNAEPVEDARAVEKVKNRKRRLVEGN